MPSFAERFMFQPPPSSYTSANFPGDLCVLNGVVCLGLPFHASCSHILIFQHANAEDLGNIYRVMRMLRDRLQVHVIALEYPGYGIASGSPGLEVIDQCANRVYRFVREKLQWPSDRIIICGRSIGTGPATKIAAEHEVAALVLVSPYTSVKDIAQNMVGCIGSAFFPSHWNSRDSIRRVKCPTMLLHGSNDTLIPPNHSQILFDECQLPPKSKKLHIIDGFGHNEINWPYMVQLMKGFLTKYTFDETLENRPLILDQSVFHTLPISEDSQVVQVGCDRCWNAIMHSQIILRLFNNS